uniref:Uncharacterized protein n=1 Tax=Ursus maritimus TaxID=29073 RepID=A0A452UXC8_URSMA
PAVPWPMASVPAPGGSGLEGSTGGIHGLGSAMAPEGNQKKGRLLLQFLADRFYDVEVLTVHQKNRPSTYIKGRYVKFQDKEWIWSNEHGHFSLKFLKFQAVLLEAVNVSSCAANYRGLDSF